MVELKIAGPDPLHVGKTVNDMKERNRIQRIIEELHKAIGIDGNDHMYYPPEPKKAA